MANAKDFKANYASLFSANEHSVALLNATIFEDAVMQLKKNPDTAIIVFACCPTKDSAPECAALAKRLKNFGFTGEMVVVINPELEGAREFRTTMIAAGCGTCSKERAAGEIARLLTKRAIAA